MTTHRTTASAIAARGASGAAWLVAATLAVAALPADAGQAGAYKPIVPGLGCRPLDVLRGDTTTTKGPGAILLKDDAGRLRGSVEVADGRDPTAIDDAGGEHIANLWRDGRISDADVGCPMARIAIQDDGHGEAKVTVGARTVGTIHAFTWGGAP